jgi:hypothetical protein
MELCSVESGTNGSEGHGVLIFLDRRPILHKKICRQCSSQVFSSTYQTTGRHYAE